MYDFSIYLPGPDVYYSTVGRIIKGRALDTPTVKTAITTDMLSLRLGVVMISTLQRHAQAIGIELNSQRAGLFERYYALLVEASHKMDLTSVLDYEGVQRRHFLESLALLVAIYRSGILRPGQAKRVLDLGTGAGFPGLPMKIAHPELNLTMLEANRKKTAFLQDLIAELGIKDVKIITGRAEEAAHDPVHRETYDLVTARAVAPLPVLVELAMPFLRLGGYLATPKGSRAAQEMTDSLRALRLCGGQIATVVPLDVPGSPHKQTLVLLKKVARTASVYPRRAGIPKKRPL